MPARPRIHVRISEVNARKLQRISGDHGVHMGALVDDALTLFFTPPDERPDAAILRRIDLLDDQLERLDAHAAFQADLLVEFIFEWLRQRPASNPLSTPADEARARSGLEALTRRVAERSSHQAWN